MSAETATAKRVTRTLRASPTKERTPIPREDVENMSAVTLAALGMSSTSTNKQQQRDVHPAATTPQASDRAYKRMSKTSSEMYATPPSTVMPVKSRTVSSSAHVSGNNNNAIHNSSSGRTRDRTTTSSSIASSDALHGQSHAQAPLTAIRRPAPQSHQNTTPAGSRSASSSNNTLSAGRAVSGSMKASPSSMRLSTSGSNSAVRSRKTSNNSSIAVSNNNNHNTRDTPTSTRSRAPSPDASRHLQREEEEQQDKVTREKGVFVTQEEYSSLVDLLSAKDEQITSLKDQVDEHRKELFGLKERNNKLQKEKEVLMIEKKDLFKIATSSSNSGSTVKDGNNNSPSQSEDGSISKKEYESFKKQYEMQENLLEGFQRENEKATIELEALKKRDKYLTEQLKKIYGPSFSVDNEFNPNTPEQGGGPSKRFPSTLLGNGHGHGHGSPLNGGMFIGEKQRRRSGFGLLPISSKPPPLNGEDDDGVTQAEDGDSNNVKEERKRNTEVEPAILMEQIVSVQSLLERFEKRLLVRESELIKKEREAVEQMERLQIVVAAV